MLNNLGTALCDVGEFREAVDIFRRAVALDPASAESHCSFADALFQIGPAKEAEAHYRQAITLRPGLARAHLGLAMALRAQRRAVEAEASCRAALAIDPDSPEAICLLGELVPDIRIRVVNVVDLMALQPQSEHPHGLNETEYDELFTKQKHIIFAFHGYPSLVHRLTYRRPNRNIHVRGYIEEGTITTAFDIRVQNKLDRFHLVQDVVDRVPGLGTKGAYLRQLMADKLIEHTHYIDKHGEDLLEVRNWKWSATA